MSELIQVGDNTFYITGATQLGIYRQGTQAWLIDSGIDKDSAKKAIKAIASLGCTLKAVLNTHGHADHVGGNACLVERTGCAVYANEKECDFIRHTILNTTVIWGGYPPAFYRKNKFFYASPSPAQRLEEAELPENFDVIPLPGHSVGMTAYRTPDGVVFAGDAVSGEKILEKYHINYAYDIQQYLESMDKLAELEGVMFVPCHAPAEIDIRPLAEQNRAKAEKIMVTVREICREGVTFDGLRKSVMDHFGLEMSESQYVLISSTLRSYLSCLCDRGEVRPICRDGDFLFQSAE